MTARQFLLAAVAVALATPFGFAADLPPAYQRDQEKKVQAEVERTARQVETALRVLMYQRVAADDEQKTLSDVAAQLRGLGDDQIRAVLKHLDAAVTAPDEATASTEQKAAYVKHRQVVVALKGMLEKLDTLKSLDHAAERYDRLAKEEYDLALKAVASQQAVDNPFGRGRRTDTRDEQADTQADLRTELVALTKLVAGMKSTLTPDQKARVEQADPFGKGGQLAAEMQLAAEDAKGGEFRASGDRDRKISKDLQALAAALRSPREKIAALKEARDKVEKLIKEQEALTKETIEKPESKLPEFNGRGGFNRGGRVDPEQARTAQLADKQARLEYDTRETRKAIETIPVAKEVAGKIVPAEGDMRKSEDELRQTAPERSVEPQRDAADKLRDARNELDKLIAQAEKDKADPLAAVKNAAEQVKELIKEQMQTKDVTRDTAAQQKDLRKPTEMQKQVAKKANDLRNLPLPETPAAKDALAKATESAQKAAENLSHKDAEAAQPKQEDTLKHLEAAKKALEDKAGEIEKRREEMAKLEEAAKKLDELARKEQRVSDGAKETKPQDKPAGKTSPRSRTSFSPPRKKWPSR